MELQAITGKLYIVNGVSQETTHVPGLLALSPPSGAARGRHRDMLFINLTLTGQLEETVNLSQDILDTISYLYYRTSGSVTAALRKAIIEANKGLLSYNLSSRETIREGALACAVLREEELYIAQVGEAFSLIGHNIGVERLPPVKPEKITPLGRTAGIDIRFYHNWLQTGDMLLLADTRMAHVAPTDLAPVLIDNDVESGLLELARHVDSDSARAILVEFSDEAPGFVPDAARPQPAKSGDRRLPPPTSQPLRDRPVDARTQPAIRPGSPAPRPDSSLPRPVVDVEVMETAARRATSHAAKGLSRGTGWLADLLGKVRPPQRDEGESISWALPAFLAVVIPLIVAIIVTGVYVQRGKVAQYGELKRAMQEQLSLARQAGGNEEVAASHYEEVLRLAHEAELLRPGDADLLLIREEAIHDLDGLSDIARFNSRLLYQYQPGTSLQSIVLGESAAGDIFVLDSVNSRVYYQNVGEDFLNQANSSPEQIVFSQQVIGSHIVGELADMMWRPQGNQVTRDGLAMLDLRGALITFYPNFADTRAVPLGLASDWSQPSAVAAFNERLYILDPAAKRIWRYFAEGDGFTLSDEQRYIEFTDDPDVDQVQDFAIYSEDGSVLLLYKDGRFRRFANGRLLWTEADLVNNGLSLPLVAPTSVEIVGQGLNQSVFVLDPGSDRIVQFSIGGVLLAQYKASDEIGQELFVNAVDFAVAENPLRILVISKDSVYVTSQD